MSDFDWFWHELLWKSDNTETGTIVGLMIKCAHQNYCMKCEPHIS